MNHSRLQQFLFIIILSVSVIVPLTNDIFLSGIPEMKLVFVGCDLSLVMSISLLGLAVAQPFYGPLLDRFGRKPVLLTGLLIYILASANIMFAHSYASLIIGRFFQAVGACSAITSALAIARDTYKKEEELVSATSLIMAIMGAGPALAPFIGSFLNHLWGWRASFDFLFVLGCFFIVWISFFLKETHLQKNMEALAFKKILKNYANFARHSKFLKYCVISGFSYGVLFSYLNLSSFFIIEKMHFSLVQFGAIVALNALTIISTAMLVPRIVRKISIQVITQLGLAAIFLGGFLMWLLNMFVVENIYSFMLPIFVTTLGIGMIRPTASAGAMQLVQSNLAGSAASFFNLFSFVSGMCATLATATFIQHASSFGLFIAVMGAAALVLLKLVFATRA